MNRKPTFFARFETRVSAQRKAAYQPLGRDQIVSSINPLVAQLQPI